MKKILLFTVFAMVVSHVQATIHTVSNRPGNPAQFEVIQDAVDAATAGDTIYIAGSVDSYSNIELNKQLVFIGPGYNSQKEHAFASNIPVVALNTKSNLGNGSKFIGLKIGWIDGRAANILIKRCEISRVSSTNGNSWVLEENILNSVEFTINSPLNVVNNANISNNVIMGAIYANYSIIKSNVFLRASTLGRHNIIENNIFFNVSSVQSTHNFFSTYNNNITYLCAEQVLTERTNNGSGNFFEKDPGFVHWDILAGNNNFPKAPDDYSNNFRLNDNSIALGAGTNGTDIGLYGGIGFSETGEPAIPVVLSFLIKNGVIEPDGKLNVVIEAETKN
jgi:hypothetical protein